MIECYDKYNNKKLRKINNDLYEELEFIFDMDYSAEMLFDEYIYNKDPDKYQLIADELEQFIKDDFLHYLKPLHQKALYNALVITEEDLNDSLKFEANTKEEKDSFKNRLDNVHYYLSVFFEDYDFLSINIYFEPRNNDNDDALFLLGIDDYLDLLPSDLVERYNLSKRHQRIYNEICKSTVDIYRDNIPVKLYAEGTYLDGLFYILNHEVDININDSIIYIDEENKFRKTFKINNIDDIKVSDYLPSYLAINATLVDRELITHSTNQTYNTNINGSNNNIAVNSAIHGDMINRQNIHEFFDDIRNTFNQNVEDIEKRNVINDAVTELEKSIKQENFKDKYNKLIETASNHITLLQPFLSRLHEFF